MSESNDNLDYENVVIISISLCLQIKWIIFPASVVINHYMLPSVVTEF